MGIKEKFIQLRKPVLNGKKIVIKKPDFYHKILIITNDSQQENISLAKSFFSNAEINHFYLRASKEDKTTPFSYSAHPSDFNLTGHLKNDKLTKMLQLSFDLVIDLSNNSKVLQFFISRINTTLMVGKLNSAMSDYYDMMFEDNLSTSDFLNCVSTNSKTFSQHG